ncbi:MAG: glycoside hydrolase family 3 N-terminal domain-containing protein [Mailhella sp.]
MNNIAALIMALWGCFFAHSGYAQASPSAEDMAGAMIMTGFRGTEAPKAVLQAISRGQLGGVILFDKEWKTGTPCNIDSPEQLKKLVSSLHAASPRTLFVAVDQEGGKVSRLKAAKGFFSLPSAKEMGRMDMARVRELGFQAGREMKALGINIDLAPVVDLQRFSSSPGLGDKGRLFGAAPSYAASRALAFSDGLHHAGVLPALKHFPGLGSARKDSHHELPDITESWLEDELIPYKEAFRRGWPGMVLVAHVYHRRMDDSLPASLSPFVVDGLLRKKLGWNGVVISDDLQMAAASGGRTLDEIVFLAIQAGNDILLFGNNLAYDPLLHEKVFHTVMNLVRKGKISRKRLEASWKRIQALKSSMKKRKHEAASLQ